MRPDTLSSCVRRCGALSVSLGAGLLDLLYPRYCCHCGVRVGSGVGHLCWDCRSELAYIRDPYCRQCGDPPGGVVHHDYTCAWCRRTGPAFDQARSVVRYGGAAKSAIHALKYHHGIHLRRDLADLLAGGFAAHYRGLSIDAVLPVPLFPTRERERTYNQAALLATALAGRIDSHAEPRLLQRIRDTGSQIRLTARERRRNVRDAFAVRFPEHVEGRRLLLIDDVMTTGCTCHEAARALKRAGATAVFVLTVARG